MNAPSTRARVVTRRTYNRPLNEEGTEFETWEQTVDRVCKHQMWLWQRAKGTPFLEHDEFEEIMELRQLMLERKLSVSGRTLWLGGTDVAQTREASQFNCSFGKIETVHDVVDAFWLLLQGCGVGFEPVVGTLNGFAAPVEIEVIRSKKTMGDPKGNENNIAHIEGDIYYLRVGDSAEAWAKSLGKLLAMKDPVDKVIIDFSEVRAAGIRLKGYGWISSGDETISKAFVKICEILNKRSGQLLTRIDILDILNHMGTTLSSRRSAEIAVMPVDDPEIDEFITAKKDFWLYGNEHRQQSNNSIMFHRKPTKWELSHIFEEMQKAGGSEPGFINAEAAKRRAPWFKGVNPCAEILLGNKSFCNLVEVDWGKFIDKEIDVFHRAVWLAARANYRQTCVDLDDGILQRSWHELNQFLRLCGVGATGIVKYLDHLDRRHMNKGAVLGGISAAAKAGACTMADELGLPRPKAVTTVKPSGTLSKIMDTTEGVHKPLGKYIFNNVTFSKHDPIVSVMREAGYKVIEKPFETDSVLITFPVSYEDVSFDEVDGKFVNLESAVEQLERYKLMMDHYVDHNCSVTISYDPSEVPEIVEWIMENWDSYVGVSFIYRNDPTKTAEDLGYAYLPQEVVTQEDYEAYVSMLAEVDLGDANSFDELQDEGCATGQCPIR
jgi:ribonucleoside-triphosphate reductase